MKNTTFRTVVRTLGLFLLIGIPKIRACAGNGPATQQTGKSAQSERDQFIGTWQTWVTPRNCATGAAVAPAFAGILTFAKGETLTGTSATVPSVFGNWDRLQGWHNYSFSFISLRYNAAGGFIGTQVVSGKRPILSASGR